MQPVREDRIWCHPHLYRIRISVIILLWCCASSFGKLVFIAEPRTTPILLGGGFKLDCSAKDTLLTNQKITYKWLFNGGDLRAKFPGASFFQNNTVYMTQITKEHLGEYRCTANLNDGTSTKSAQSKTAVILLAYIQDFVIHPTSVSTNDTSNAIFTCVTGKSAPPPTIYWERNGAVFLEGTKTQAVFGTTGTDTSGQLSMWLEVPTNKVLDGKFACVAINPLSKEQRKSKTADLSVKVISKPPTIDVAPPTSIIAPANLRLELRCVISGVPEPNTTWVQGNGTEVTNSSRVISATNGSLIFRPLQEADTGLYTCKGENDRGTVSAKPTNLTVAVLSMEFKIHPSNTSAIRGRAVTLYCSAPYSVPPANITWYKDNKIFRPRSGEYAASILNTGDLYFSNIQMNDQGIYFCVAINSFAEPRTRASGIAAITVTGAPQILTPPIPTTVLKDGLLRLTCIVKGDPFPTVTWSKGETMLVAGDRVSFRNLNQELWIARMAKPDSGTYSCKAGNKYGSIRSQSVLVDIVVPPQILQSIQSQRITEGTSVQLNCVIFGDPTPTIVWKKDGYPLTQSAFVQVTMTRVTFPRIRAEDAGTYVCQATNKGGMRESVGKITVLVKPTFVNGQKDVTVNSGAAVEMTCDGAGVPTPTVSWSYNKTKTFPTGVSLSLDKKKLTISNARIEHIGTYRCTLTNEVGTASQEGKLVVQVSPTIQSITGSKVISQGRDLSLTCIAYGIPYPKITWSLNGKELKETTNKRITFPTRDTVLVKFITMSDAGDYKCAVENVLGKSEAQTKVYVRDPPRPPVLEVPKSLSLNSVKLTWIPVTQEINNNVTHWVIQYRLSIAPDFTIYRSDVPAALTSYEVSGLKAATTYHFRMGAKNEVGIGRYTGVLSATTFETAPSAPRNIKLVSVQARNATLSWEKPSNLQAADVTDYEVHYRRTDRVEGFAAIVVAPVLPTQIHTVVNLHPDRPYEFKVRAATRENDVRLWGSFSETITANTSMALPTLPPQNVVAKVSSNTSVQLSWQPIPEESQNGRVSLYRVRYKETNIASNQETIVSAPATSVVITKLRPWRFYTFTVSGMNPIGHSPYSAAVVARTLPGLPTGSPQDVTLMALSSTSLSINWKAVAADKQNSAISGYVLHYRDILTNKITEITVNGSDTLTANISGLEPWREYSIRVQAFTNQFVGGRGPLTTQKTVRTKPDIPGKVRNLKIVSSAYSATVVWDAPTKPNGVIGTYIVVYSLIGRVQVAESSTVLLSSDGTSAEGEVSSANSQAQKHSRTEDGETESSQTVESTEPITVNVKGPVSPTEAVIAEASTTSGIEPVDSTTEQGESDTVSNQLKSGTTSKTAEAQQPGSRTRKKRDAGDPSSQTGDKPPPKKVVYPTWTINSSSPHITLQKLEPSSIYNISVVAVTPAGSGKEPVTATFTTLPTGVPTKPPTTKASTPQLLPFGIRQEHLAYFIGGCVAIALIIIILVIVIILCCVRRKRKKEAPRKFFVPPPASSMGDKVPSLTDVTDQPSTRKLKSSQQTTSKSSNVSFNPNPLIHMREDSSSEECLSSHSGGVRPKNETRPHTTSGFSTPSYDHSHSGTSLSEFNLVQDLSSIEGIENPGYHNNQGDSDSDNTKISNIPMASSTKHYPSGRKQDMITKRLTYQMKRRSAQVIAMQRERQSTLVDPDEIDLLAHESVVVYDERTAL